MGRLVSLFVLLVLGAVFCDHDLPKLGTFEGTYTTPIGGLLHLCLDAQRAQGYYNEVGLLQGDVSDDGNKINGNFYFAGHGNCITGTFELELTSWGLEGFYICSGRPGVSTISAVKLHPFRPTDDQCALLWNGTPSGNTLEGFWVDSSNKELGVDLCFRAPDDDNGDDDDETVQGSMRITRPSGQIVDQFVSGYWSSEGRVFSGTWYQNLNAGAIIMWLRNNGQIDYSWWTGLVFEEGDTFISYAQLHNPLYHGTGSYKPSANRTSTFDQCKRYEILQYYVLKNLPVDDDDNYYYFLDDAYIDPADIRYINRVESDNSATGIVLSFAVFIVGVIALIF